MVQLARFLRVVRPDARGRLRVTGRTIYILPTRYGVVFGLLLATLLIASINYANNPAFLLTFLLAGIFFQAIFHTWRNLKGLELRCLGAAPVFAGDRARIRLKLRAADGGRHPGLRLAFDGETPVAADLSTDGEAEVTLGLRTRRRGRQPVGRLRLESRYPLGLLRAWCYLEPGHSLLVWPRPLKERLETGAPAWEGSQQGDRGVGADDFAGHRNYHPGDPPSRLHWKALAAEKGLLVKAFGGDRVNRLWLEFDALAPHDTETRLGLLAGAVERLSREAVHFGLRLPRREIPPASGEVQRRRCLDALALFDATDAGEVP
ncbi:MAG TPA: DUF58 domain-containing protein [Thiolapillus brandeum]|uniref:DUF58 domain-containing protein n=1 Tax=Thiolapillus brandeum TaxID=1076588 RepID=A0A7C5MVD3_9GAMM|nr:DUF58 domain-containing protein [Thiolapillus brandeum]